MCTIRVPINVCAKYQKACYYKLGGLLRKKVTFCLAIYRKYSQCKFNPFFCIVYMHVSHQKSIVGLQSMMPTTTVNEKTVSGPQLASC